MAFNDFVLTKHQFQETGIPTEAVIYIYIYIYIGIQLECLVFEKTTGVTHWTRKTERKLQSYA